MNPIHRRPSLVVSAIVAVLLAIPATTFATTFDFSYLFNDGTLVSGSFDGTQNGNFVEGVSNISVLFSADTPQAPGPLAPLYVAKLNASNDAWISGSVISFTALDNNFHFANYNILGAPPYNGWGFFMVGSISQATNYYGFDNSINYDRNVMNATRWSLSARPGNSVPDSGDTALMIAGALSAGYFFRRRPAR